MKLHGFDDRARFAMDTNFIIFGFAKMTFQIFHTAQFEFQCIELIIYRGLDFFNVEMIENY